jgi:Metallo-peptidase family M12/Secretion system C-terminal sorting domain/GEVED domain
MRAKTLLLLFLPLFCITSLFSQSGNPIFEGQKFQSTKHDQKMSVYFDKYDLFDLNINEIKSFCSAKDYSDFTLKFDNQRFINVHLFKKEIRTDDYVTRVATKNGIVTMPKGDCITYQGFTDDGAKVAFTINDDFIVGYFKYSDKAYFLEQIEKFDATAAKSTVVFYDTNDIIPDENAVCAGALLEKKKHEHEHLDERVEAKARGGNMPPVGCVQIRLAIAADFSYYTLYGSNTVNVTNQTVTVNNNVNTDYDDDFNKLISYLISETYISTTSTSAFETAITATTDASVMLGNFRTWGNTAGNFANPFDLGSYWTDRDIVFMGNANTVGLASTGGLCSTYKYNLLEDFTTNAASMRNMVSHEYGHNWNYVHDPAGSTTIMAPTVNGSNTWSAASIAAFNAHEASSACNLGTHVLAGTPNATFNIPISACKNSSVTLTSTAGRSATAWTWAASGVVPSSTNTQNSTVTFPTAGSKSITHTASNNTPFCGASSNTVIKTIDIINQNPPTAACALGTANTSTGGSFGMGIFNVTFGTLNVSSGGSYEEGIAYKDISCVHYTTLNSLTNNISVQVGNINNESVRVLIDLNNNGSFSASESLYLSPAPAMGVHAGTITIPINTAVPDVILRMRVMSNFGGAPAVGCTLPSYGQVEDYGVIIPASVALPVDLVRFEGKKVGQTTQLDWQTGTETNNKGFFVERSVDGKNYQRLIFVNGANNSTTLKKYQYVDNKPLSGLNYYRLVQVDFDGTEKYANTISVIGDSENHTTIYPNPMQSDVLNVLYKNDNIDTDIQVTVFDLNGRIIFEQKNAVEKGLNKILLDLSTLPKGFYCLSVGQNNQNELIKFVK